MYIPVPYHIAGGCIYACLLILCILALFYGFRARRNVKKEKITSLPRGFSPLDIQRIFIGKTYPGKLTRALIVHWARLGYIRVKYVSRYKVKLVRLKFPPAHDNEKAVFFDRGTYVRERDIFCELFARKGAAITVNLNKPLITSALAKSIDYDYAAREDEGVYSTKHYKLKVLTFVLSFMPVLICSLYLCFTNSFMMVIPPFAILIGMFVLRFIKGAPFFFRLIWSSVWIGAGLAMIIVCFHNMFDPLLLGYASIVILFLGSFVLVRFVDHRVKNNLSDYSDLVNFRKFLLFSGKDKLSSVDYYEVLPYLYAFNIKPLVKRKFATDVLPDWFESEDGKRGSLL